MIAIAREFILSRYKISASKSDLQHGNNSIIIFFRNLDNLYFCQHHDQFYFFCQHLDHLHFFQIADPAAAYHYGITTLPSLVYFKNSVPNLFDGETSISHKRGKSNIVSARQICISPDETLEG